ncbi:unknown [Ruminococcus sp. CAG:17]|nr:unknown [Ruminococcus sp. CAG:17]
MCRRCILLLKRPEDLAEEVFFDSLSRITDTDHKMKIISNPVHLPKQNLYRSSRRSKFIGIGNEIDNNLTETHLITNHVFYIKILHLDLPVDTLGFCSTAEHGIQFINQLFQRKGNFFQLNLAAFDSGHIQDIVDQSQKKM